MREALQQLLAHVWMVLHRRWLALGGAILICAAGWAYVHQLPDEYRVSTRVYLDTQSILQPLLRGITVETTTMQDAAVLMRRTLITRPNIERVLRTTDMDLAVTTPPEMDALVSTMSASLSLDQVVIPGRRESNLYELAFRHEDPQLAKKVVDAMLDIFFENLLGTARTDTQTAQAFLDAQIADYETRLAESEERLKNFRLEHFGALPEEGRTYMSRLNAEEARLQDTRLLIQEAERRAASIRGQIQDVVAAIQSNDQQQVVAQVLSPLDLRIQEMEKRLDELQMSFTEQHPDVVATRRMLEQLNQQRDQERQAAAAAGAGEAGATGPAYVNVPAYQELKVLLGQTEAEAAALKARAAEYERRIADMRGRLTNVAEVEAQMIRLDRDYNAIKATYDRLLQSREAAGMSEEVGRTADTSRFRIIEPPRVPLSPSGPDRIRLISMVLAAGIAGGAGLAWLFAQLRPTFYSRRQLGEFAGVPVLGSVTMFWTPVQLAKRRLGVLTFAGAFACLLGVYGVLMAGHLLGFDPIDKVVGLAQGVL